MTVDERIGRRLNILADLLREDVTRQVQSATHELAGIIEAERAEAAAVASREARESATREADQRFAERLADAESRIAAAENRARDEGREAGRAAGHKDGLAAGLEQGRHEGREALRAELETDALAASERLVYAIQSIDRARSLSEVLDTLASGAGREAARVALLIVAGERLRGWRLIGFGPDLEDPAQCELSIGDAGIVADAIRNTAVTSADSAADRSAPSFAKLPPGHELVALPLSMSGQVVAVLYADQAGLSGPDRRITVAWPATLEVLTRHAARSLEALTAVRATQVLSERPEPLEMRTDRVRDPRIAHTNGDERETARRYAKLLISEIKLCNESAVAAGRRERDLASRLGGEIARARALYDKRVRSHVGDASEMFHAELVRTLADGDAGLLGARKS